MLTSIVIQKERLPEGSVRLEERVKRARLEVSNTYKEGKAVDYGKFFERFYRIEESHNNKEHRGFGIGLSMAQSMVKLFKGVESLPPIKMTPSPLRSSCKDIF